MNNKLDQKKFDDIYFEGKPMYDKVNGGTFNVVYLREYIDPECESETFAAYETIYRNVPNKFRKKFNDKTKLKIVKFLDWNYKETASNFTGVSGVEMIHGSEYYRTYEDEFGKDYLAKSAERTGGNKSHWKHRAVWRFIELIAIEEIEKLNRKRV